MVPPAFGGGKGGRIKLKNGGVRMYNVVVRMFNSMVAGGFKDYQIITELNRGEFEKKLHKEYGTNNKIISFTKKLGGEHDN